jgi:hypothetical protein
LQGSFLLSQIPKSLLQRVILGHSYPDEEKASHYCAQSFSTHLLCCFKGEIISSLKAMQLPVQHFGNRHIPAAVEKWCAK